MYGRNENPEKYDLSSTLSGVFNLKLHCYEIPELQWIFIVLTAFWVFFFEWELNYLNKRQILRTEIQRNTIYL